MADSFDRKRLAPLKDTVAIVGVGETDYGADYRGAGGKAVGKGEARVDHYTLASRALKRALDDSGLGKDDIDGAPPWKRQNLSAVIDGLVVLVLGKMSPDDELLLLVSSLSNVRVNACDPAGQKLPSLRTA